MKKKIFPLSKVYRLLETGPVVLVTTRWKGKANVMTLAWHTMMDFEPPTVGMVMGEQAHSFKSLKATRECVINIPTVELVKKVVACGNATGRKTDKFKAFGLTPVAASCVKSPLIFECFASLECKVVDAHLAAKRNFFILEVVKAWVDPSMKDPETVHHRGKGLFMVAGRTMEVSSRMK
jgi:flavin reductase (DIM6/NTAB) family NADH-FMN oxidoreductase RutF